MRHQFINPEVDEAVAAHGNLKQTSTQWEGPCPVCRVVEGDGGDDRLHIKQATNRQGALIFCRHCAHRYGHRKAYEKLLRALGLKTRRAGRDYKPPELPNDDESKRRRVEKANAIWNEAVDPEGTLASVYLRDVRQVWPHGVRLPDSVRWFPNANPQTEAEQLLYAGAVVWRCDSMPQANHIIRDGECSAIQYEILTSCGDRLPDPHRVRRTRGMRKGAVCAVGAMGGDPVVLVEGEVTALAAVHLAPPGSQVLSFGSCGFLDAVVPLLQRPCNIKVWPDEGGESQTAALKFKAKMEQCSTIPVSIEQMHTAEKDSDAADLLRQYIHAGKVPAFKQVINHVQR